MARSFEYRSLRYTFNYVTKSKVIMNFVKVNLIAIFPMAFSMVIISCNGAHVDSEIEKAPISKDEFDSGYSAARQLSDDSLRLFLRNATNEEFVEFLIKSKLLPSTTDAATAKIIKRVEELGRKGTPVSEGDIEKLVKDYEEEIENLDFLTDELRDGLVSRFRKQLNQARVPSSQSKF